jgi:carbon-monoxide dehydrogenase large subunit
MKVPNSYIGRPMERVEDLRFLRGRGTYVSDVNRPGQLYAAILRSPQNSAALAVPAAT